MDTQHPMAPTTTKREAWIDFLRFTDPVFGLVHDNLQHLPETYNRQLDAARLRHDLGWAASRGEIRTAGQVAFEAYNKQKGGKTWDGKDIPPWGKVGDEVQAGWNAAALAVAIDHGITKHSGGVSKDPQTIRDWQVVIHKYAKDKGWWDSKRSVGDIFLLFASEVHEAYDEYRNGRGETETYFKDEHGETFPMREDGTSPPGMKPEGVPTELADVVIRIFDYCEFVGIDLQAIMEVKHAYNLTRAYRHGGKRT